MNSIFCLSKLHKRKKKEVFDKVPLLSSSSSSEFQTDKADWTVDFTFLQSATLLKENFKFAKSNMRQNPVVVDMEEDTSIMSDFSSLSEGVERRRNVAEASSSSHCCSSDKPFASNTTVTTSSQICPSIIVVHLPERVEI